MLFRNKTPRALALLLHLALVASAIADTHQWLGLANDVAQVTQTTASGAFITGETVTAEINNQQVILTLGTDTATTDVVAELAAAINANDYDDGLVGATADEERNVGGQEIGEFNDVIASSSGSVLSVKSKVPGVPFTISFSDSSASGALSAASTTTNPTGKNWFDNADNWNGGLPANGDTIAFEGGSEDCIWAMDHGYEELSVIKKNSYTGNIGRPVIDSTHSGKSFRDYRTPTKLELENASGGSGTQTFIFGDRNNTTEAQGAIYLDMKSQAGTAVTFQLHGGTASVVGGVSVQYRISGGTLTIGGESSEVSPGVGQLGIGGTGTIVNVTDHAAGITDLAVTLDNGTLVYEASGATPDFTQYSGTLTIEKTSGTTDTLLVHGGTCNSLTGAATLKVFSDATLSSKPTAAVTFGNVTLYSGATFDSPYVMPTLTNGIITDGCTLEDVTINLPAGLKYTPAAP